MSRLRFSSEVARVEQWRQRCLDIFDGRREERGLLRIGEEGSEVVRREGAFEARGERLAQQSRVVGYVVIAWIRGRAIAVLLQQRRRAARRAVDAHTLATAPLLPSSR